LTEGYRCKIELVAKGTTTVFLKASTPLKAGDY
jgi:hypothetical protein